MAFWVRCLFPYLFLLLLTPWSSYIDMEVARWTYTPAATPDESFVSTDFLDYTYRFAVLPAYTFGYGSLGLLILSRWIPGLQTQRKIYLIFFLMLALGCGLVTNALLKDRWGRPRPKQLQEFGGEEKFQAFYSPRFGGGEDCRSFPCGHCTMGFYFFSSMLLAQRAGRRRLAKVFFAGSILLGTLLGITRILQGGHFVTDVVAGCAVMWMMAHVIDRAVFAQAPITSPTSHPQG